MLIENVCYNILVIVLSYYLILQYAIFRDPFIFTLFVFALCAFVLYVSSLSLILGLHYSNFSLYLGAFDSWPVWSLMFGLYSLFN